MVKTFVFVCITQLCVCVCVCVCACACAYDIHIVCVLYILSSPFQPYSLGGVTARGESQATVAATTAAPCHQVCNRLEAYR